MKNSHPPGRPRAETWRTFLGMSAFAARAFAVNNNNNKGNRPIIPSWKTAAIICNYVNKILVVEIIWLP